MIILGVLLLLLGYLVWPVLVTIGWIVLAIGVILLIVSATGHGGGRYYY